ncbi:MAG: mechanosensitive ion channel [Calditrichaeota bacterium]|nr:mechanosensitive ion channel [Calditrichota bacterium]
MKFGSNSIERSIIRKSLFSFILAVIVLCGYLAYSLWARPHLSASLGLILTRLFYTILTFFVILFFHRALTAFFHWYNENVVQKTQSTLDDKFLPLFHRLTIVVLWSVAFITLLSLFGINISALVATLGVSSLAIALAAQDTIANLIAGFLIMVDQPFRVGDKIKLPSGEVVTVKEIGIRRSKFYMEDKAVVIVPNVDLSKNKIVNFSYVEEAKTPNVT